MKTPVSSPHLGPNILVVLDDSPGFLAELRLMTASLPDIIITYFTLLCCCPAHCWEHGGEDTAELKQFIKTVWEEEEKEFTFAEQYLASTRAVLKDAGVAVSHILTRTATEDSRIAATMAELKRGQYSGVIVSRYQPDIINRLQGRGFTDLFRQLPKVEICVLETGNPVHETAYSG